VSRNRERLRCGWGKRGTRGGKEKEGDKKKGGKHHETPVRSTNYIGVGRESLKRRSSEHFCPVLCSRFKVSGGRVRGEREKKKEEKGGEGNSSSFLSLLYRGDSKGRRKKPEGEGEKGGETSLFPLLTEEMMKRKLKRGRGRKECKVLHPSLLPPPG